MIELGYVGFVIGQILFLIGFVILIKGVSIAEAEQIIDAIRERDARILELEAALSGRTECDQDCIGAEKQFGPMKTCECGASVACKTLAKGKP